MSSGDGRVLDAQPRNWVDRFAPASLQPFLRLSRADRPIGYWLLLLPCWWSIFLVLPGVYENQSALFGNWQEIFKLVLWMLLFAIGAIAMRGAGCTYNDIIDRDIDAKVTRTKSRPIPSGQVTTRQAAVFLIGQCLVGLAVLMQFNWFAIFLGLLSMILVLIYPFMKRVTNWPQIVLGGAFSWGALMGWAVYAENITLAPFLLYLGTIFWVIGYDTIYAHQDREDDSLIGLGSTALALGDKTYLWVSVFYAMTIILIYAAVLFAGMPWWFVVLLLPAILQMMWQIGTLDINDAENCLARFKSNRLFGFLVLIALAAVFLLTR